MTATDNSRKSDVCVFTIVSRNYIHFARTLMQSVSEHCQEADVVIALCDHNEDKDFQNEGFTIIELRDLENIPELNKFIFRYTILEINTAIKPYVFEKLFDKGYSKVLYFDPDIRVYSSLAGMLQLLERHEMLLTPHLTDLLDDGNKPDELDILVSGTYNLGYIGLRNTSQMRRCLLWWQSKLYERCVVDIEKGLFVDQKWMDLAPGLFRNVHIVSDEGWNVANWNLNHRRVEKNCDNRFTVNDDSLLFFHFSGFNPESDTLSKHQNRFLRGDNGPVVEQLCKDYAAILIENGYYQNRRTPYFYDFLHGEIRIPVSARHFYREEHDWKNDPNPIWSAEGARDMVALLNTRVEIDGKLNRYVTNLSYRIYKEREDLSKAFPHLSGADGIRYASWFIKNAEGQMRLDRCFIDPIDEEFKREHKNPG